MFCSQCGTKLEDGASFCQQCGAKVEQEAICNNSESVVINNTVKPHNKKSGNTALVLVIVFVVLFMGLWGVAFVIPPVYEKISTSKKEEAITTALDDISKADDFSCYIEMHSDVDTVNNEGVNLGVGVTLSADVTFKNEKTHAENGNCSVFMMTNNGSMHKEDFTFESYITEDNNAYTARETTSELPFLSIPPSAGTYENVFTNFSKDDLTSFFEEIRKNYEASINYSEDSRGLVIRGTLSQGSEIYDAYIDFHDLVGVDLEDSLFSGAIDYEVVLNSEGEKVLDIIFYLSDVWNLWYGYEGDEQVRPSGSYAEFTIEFRNLKDVEDFDIPSFE